MSVQFGRWNFQGQPSTPDYIEKVGSALAPYGPDSDESYSNGGISILYRAFHTTKESRLEKQPHISSSGAVITWDGRLDNRADLMNELHDFLTANSTDVAIVAAAYEKWGANYLGKLIGDWALSIWNPRERSVSFAKDPIGAKQLYYSFDDIQLTWSTILDPLVLLAGKTFEICEEYIASWFSDSPGLHLTPYAGIHAVPPACSVLLEPGKHGTKRTVSKYWDFDPGKRIRYRTNAEYEEHFRSAFATAVQRKLRSDRPVLAELSGGMDSSAIVCMADAVIALHKTDCPRLDTITWYDESKPNWGELPHFTKVEQKRGRVGHHIDAGALREDHSQIPFGAEFLSSRFAPTPIPNGRQSELFKQNAAYIRSEGYRVTLSGTGGGFTGDGVPTPTPEFQNLLARARFFTLGRQLKAWATKMNKPRLPLLWEAVQGFISARLDVPKDLRGAVWFHPGFVRRNGVALGGCPFRVKLFGPLPSFQHNLRALDATRRLLAKHPLEPDPLRELRFPYLDRNFLEYMFAIPREKIVGTGQRRLLMKHALADIVPDEILNRRKKENAPKETMQSISVEWPSLIEIGQVAISSCVTIIDLDRFEEALQNPRRNKETPIESLKRTLTLVSWLRHLTSQGVLQNSLATKGQGRLSSLGPQDLQETGHPKSLAS